MTPKLAIICLLLASILIFGCVSAPATKSPDVKPEQPKENSTGGLVQQIQTQTVNLGNQSANLLDEMKQCDALKMSQDKDFCLQTLAIEYRSPMLCSKMDDRSERDSCFQTLAVELESPTLCEKVELYIEKCYTQLAIKYEKSAYCELIELKWMRDDCRNAMRTSDKTLAKVIGNRTSIIEDVISCQSISDANERDTCLILAATEHDSPITCRLVKLSKRDCYKEIAQLRNDKEYCHYLSSWEEESECLLAVKYLVFRTN